MRGALLFSLLLFVGPAQALDLSGLKQPGVIWQTDKAKTADVTCDGQADTILFAIGKQSVWVGVVPGDGKKPQIQKFPINRTRQTQDGFCGSPKSISVSPANCSGPGDSALPDCKPVKGCSQFSLDDEDCDQFNFYWDSHHKLVRWWRN